ncbi:porin family protein [Bernardetia litoralis]|uniref:porin family protein n=1 Tax=Bernardetia litoralis TaxID=999 RepID=UPI000315F457|nr:porin family protein [Bernardetia litoralis]
MKRSIRAIATAVCAVVLTSGAAFAQDGAGETESKLMVGFKSGFNLADMRTATDVGYFTENGGNGKNFAPQIHVFGRYNFTKWVGAELELGWVQNAFTTFTNTETTYRTNNFQANALVNVRIPVLSVYHPRFYIGPSYNYNAYVYSRQTGSAYGYNFDQTFEVTNDFSPHDFGVIVGTGLQFDVKFATLLLDARYRHGLSKAIRTRGNSVNSVAPLSNASGISDVAFMVGLGFSL